MDVRLLKRLDRSFWRLFVLRADLETTLTKNENRQQKAELCPQNSMRRKSLMQSARCPLSSSPFCAIIKAEI